MTEAKPMNEATLTALRGSIEKWEKIVAGTGVDEGMRNCPLCTMFLDDGCAGCPVATAAETTNCDNTPYNDFTEAASVVYSPGEKWINTRKADTDQVIKAAQAELDFLKSLLPGAST